MPTNQVRRPVFYEGQYLEAADLTTAVDYGRVEDARHALGAHTWGIAAGLQLTEKDSPAGGGQIEVFIQPGYAWDGFGRPIAVLTPVKISPELFKSVVFNSSLDGGTPPGRLFKVWLRYDESATQTPGEGFELCGAGDRFSRIGETFRVEVGEYEYHTSHAAISVAGYQIDAQEALQKFNPQTPAVSLYDESVPYQDFPTDNASARWLILLGAVRWSPNPAANLPGNFVRRIPHDLDHSHSLRRYIGVVAGAIEAADRCIRLHERTQPYSTIPSDDLVWVEGSLRVQGDARLFGGKLDFKDQNGLDNNIPLSIQRSDVAGTGGSLQAIIGKSDQGHNTFAVGPLDSANHFVPKLTVRDDGKVGVGTATPDRALTVEGSGNTYLNIKANNGTQQILIGADTVGGIVSTITNHDLYLRAGGNVDRVVIKADGKVGIGTNTPVSILQVAGDFALQQRGRAAARSLPAGATMCWSDGTWLRLNQNLDMTKPIFGVHTPGLFAPGSLNVGGLGDWGDPGDGNVWVKGRVGIGTTTPALTLDVQGDFGRANGAATLHLWGSRIGDAGSGTLFLRTVDEGFIHFNGVKNKVVIGNMPTSFPVVPGHLLPLPVPPLLPPISLYVDGSIFIKGAVLGPSPFPVVVSDERLKKNIAPLTEALDTILRLRGVRFFWREPEKMGNLTGQQMGLVAQEVEKVLPGWVMDGPDGYKGLMLKGFEALVIEALRELNAAIGSIKARLDKLEQALAYTSKK